MSTMSSFQPFTSPIHKPNLLKCSPQTHTFALHFQKTAISTKNSQHPRLTHNTKLRRLGSSDEDAQVSEPEPEAATNVAEEEASPEQTVAIPVSPSDKLLMFFQAEGTLTDSAIQKVTQELQGTEGVSNLKVQISEGIASVELSKQTTIQATGVASSLLEVIQGAGFKLQTLNLSFEDEELPAAV